MTKPVSERIGAFLKLALFAAVPVYLVVDFALGSVNGDLRRKTREELCFKFENKADEWTRQKKLPVTILGKFDHFLRCANIQEISFLGGKLEIEQAIEKKKENTESSSELVGLLDAAIRMTDDLTDATPDVSVVSEATELKQSLLAAQKQILSQVKFTEARIESLQALDPTPLPNGEWLLVVGADQGDTAAIDQVAQTGKILAAAAKKGVELAPNRVALRLIRSWRRTVIVFETRDGAQSALSALAADLPFDGYVRAQTAWCPDLADEPDIGGIETLRCVN